MSKDEKRNGNGGYFSALIDSVDTSVPSLRELADEVRALGGQKSGEKRAGALLRLAKALRESGRLTDAEWTFMVMHTIESLCDDRLMQEDISPALAGVSARMREVELAHGLTPDQFWPSGQGPEEYEALSAEYNRLLDATTAATLEEFGATELATMFRYSRSRLDELREQGRKMFFPGADEKQH